RRAQVGEQRAALLVVDRGPRRDAQHQVGAARPVLVLATAVLASARAQRLGVGQVEERCDARVDAQHDVAAVAPVAAVRPPARYIFLAPEAHAAIAAVARLDAHAHLVDELHGCGDGSPGGSPATKMLRAVRKVPDRAARAAQACGFAAGSIRTRVRSLPMRSYLMVPSTSANSVQSRPTPTFGPA